MKLSTEEYGKGGNERGDEYDYEHPRVQRLLKRARRKDERSGK